MIDVSVIIVNYNTRDLTLQCLDSLYRYTTGISFEVIVVDNNSSDGSVASIRKHYPQVLLIAHTENAGFGRGNNIGILQAKGKYLFLLNSDCILCNNAVGIFFKYMENCDPAIGAIGTLLINGEGKTGHSYGYFSTFGRIIKQHGLEYIHKLFPKQKKAIHPKPPFEVEYIIGADIFVRKSVLDSIGLFDDRFFMYSEENELQYRMFLAGYRRVIIAGPEIIHLEGGEYRC